MNLISEDLSIIEMNRAKVKMNKPIPMYDFWYDYMKQKYDDNVKLYYVDTDSFITNIKIFTKILLMMLKKDLIHQIMKLIDHYPQERIKK